MHFVTSDAHRETRKARTILEEKKIAYHNEDMTKLKYFGNKAANESCTFMMKSDSRYTQSALFYPMSAT